MTRSEFQQWKASPVTQEVFSILRETRDAYVNQLVASAGQPDAMRVSGNIEAFNYLLNIDFEGDE